MSRCSHGPGQLKFSALRVEIYDSGNTAGNNGLNSDTAVAISRNVAFLIGFEIASLTPGSIDFLKSRLSHTKGVR
jgi:hypothetical protein